MNNLQQQLEEILHATLCTCEAQCREYGGEELSVATQNRLKLILSCKTTQEAWALSTKIIEGNQVHFLALWAKKKVRGKVTPKSLEKEIQKANNLACFLDRKELHVQAESQRERAAKLKDELDNLNRRKQ